MRKLGLILTIYLSVGGVFNCVVSAAIAQQDILLLLDNSSTMRQHDPEHLTRTVVSRFLQRQSEYTQISILLYDNRVIPIADFTPITDSTRAALIKGLDQLNYSGRHTNSAAAMERAIYELKTNGRQAAQKSIVYVTGRAINTGNQRQDQEFSQWLREILADEAAQAGIRIYGIGLTDAADFQIIQTLAHKTGGAYYRINEVAELQSAFDRINTRLGTETYVSVAPGSQAEMTQQPTNHPTGVQTVETTQSTLTTPTQSRVRTPTSTAPEAPDQEHRTPIVQPTPAAKTTPTTQPSIALERDGALWIRKNAILLIILMALLAIGTVAVAGLAFWRRKRTVGAPIQAKQTPSSGAYTPPAMLEDTGGITSKQSYDITGKLTWISRGHGEDSATTRTVVIRNDLISRDHAVIQYKNFGYWIADRGSINGTFVNDKKITEERLLKHGDRIRFAKFEFDFAMPQREDLAATVFVKAASDRGHRTQGSANTREIPTEDAHSEKQCEPQPKRHESKTEEVSNISRNEPANTAVTHAADDVQNPALDTPQQKAEAIREQANNKPNILPADAEQIPLYDKGDTEEIANVDLLKEIINQSSADQEQSSAAVDSSEQAEEAGKTQTVPVNVPADGADHKMATNTGADSDEPVKQHKTQTAVANQSADAEDRTMIKGPSADSGALAEEDKTQVVSPTLPVDGEDRTMVTEVKKEKADDDTIEHEQLSKPVDDKTMIRPRK